MSNIRLAFQDIPLNSTVLAHTTEDSSFPAENVIAGGRDITYRTSAAVTSAQIDFDLGSPNTAQPDYVIISNANRITEKLVASATATITLSGDSSSGFGTAETESAAIDSTDLVGPNSEDYILETTFASAYRYWRISVSTGSDSFIYELGKIYFGNLFDFGRDPDAPARVDKQHTGGERKARYVFSLTWSNVTDTKRGEFIDKIGRYNDFVPVFIYESSDVLFNGDKLVHCRITGYNIEPIIAGYSRISVDFEELI